MDNNFGIVDYLVLAGTLLFSLLIGVYYACIKKQKTNDDLLMGGRNMSVFPIACSLMATNVSASSILGSPAEVYRSGALIITLVFASLIVAPINCYLFVPTYYKLRLTSVYEYLQRRYESRIVRWLAAITFIIQMILFMGVVLFAPAIAMKTFLDFPIWASIVVLGLCTTVYTAFGGLRAVVWTDVFQSFVMLAGLFAICIKSVMLVGGIGETFSIANQAGRLALFDFRFDPFMRHTTWNLFFGMAFVLMCTTCTSQQVVQRYSSMPTLQKSIQVMLINIPMTAFSYLTATLCGIALTAIYVHCDPVKLGLIGRIDEIVPFFVVRELSFVPGMVGLFLSCIVAASLSTVSSALNSMAAIVWADFLSKIPTCGSMSPSSQGLVCKATAFVVGCLAMGFAFLCSNLGNLFTMSFTINGSLMGPLGGTFLLGFFFPFANKWGALVGMIVGHCCILSISLGAVIQKGKLQFDSLPSDINGCPKRLLAALGLNNTSAAVFNTTDYLTDAAIMSTTEMDMPITCPEEEGWMTKLYELSYILYAMTGVLITISVGIVVSLLTGGNTMTEEKENYINPDIVRLTKWCRRTFNVGYNPLPQKREDGKQIESIFSN